jgi:predicted RND superfamily exporter protein
MRSIRYAIATVIPILLVVAWLYGIMYVSGFSLNFVTAMIGAISIGIGIDYSIHITERFREELKRTNSTTDAIKITASGTGVALVASAASSIVGFAILGFAPMPMFAAYGQLTAVMVFLALIASLIVLPCLLLVVTDAPTLTSETKPEPIDLKP